MNCISLYFVVSLLILCFPLKTGILVFYCVLLLKGFSGSQSPPHTYFELGVINQLATSFSHAQQILPSLNPVFLSGCMVFPTLGLQFLSLECDF